MDKLSDMYYLLRFIIDRIFVYLRDLILHEMSWFPEEIDELDNSGAKARGHPFTRRAIADFVAFFTICAFFGSFVFLSTKCSKDDDDNYKSRARPITAESEGEPLELLEEDDDLGISGTPLEETQQNSWGDAIMSDNDFESDTPRKKVVPGRNPRFPYFDKKNRDSRCSIYELRPSHSQSTQTNERILQRTAKNRDWLIRRTRSGHIYGKYPM